MMSFNNGSPARGRSPWRAGRSNTPPPRTMSPATTGSPFRNVLQPYPLDSIEAKLLRLMKDFHSTVTVPLGPKLALLLEAHKKSKYYNPEDRNFLETIIQRNVSLMSNVENTLKEAMQTGTSVEVSVVQKSERLWRECNEQNVELKIHLGIDGETTLLYGLKAKQKMRAERVEASCLATANCSVRAASPHRDYSLYRGRSNPAPGSPARLRAGSPLRSAGTPNSRISSQVTLTPSKNSPAKVILPSPAPASLEEVRPPNRDLPKIPERQPRTKRGQSPMVVEQVTAAAMADPILAQVAELIHTGKATTNDIKECHRIFKRQHGSTHGNSRFVTWLSQFPSASLEGLLDGFWTQPEE